MKNTTALLLAGFAWPAFAQLPAPPRILDGEALYSLHCLECHTSQVHWRDKRLATNWDTLRAQVRRWEGNLRLNWSEREVDDVARYLNTYFYRYPAPEGTIGMRLPRNN